MPAAKHARRSQRNRRRSGITKFIDAPFNGPAATEITVAGAGSDGPGGVNGTYAYEGGGLWRKSTPGLFAIKWYEGLWTIIEVADDTVMYTAEVEWPPAANPPKTGWIIGAGDGVAPPPTLDYI